MLIRFPVACTSQTAVIYRASAQLNTGGMVQVLNDDNLVTHVVAKGAETEPQHMAVYSKIFMTAGCNRMLRVIAQQEQDSLHACNRQVRR